MLTTDNRVTARFIFCRVRAAAHRHVNARHSFTSFNIVSHGHFGNTRDVVSRHWPRHVFCAPRNRFSSSINARTRKERCLRLGQIAWIAISSPCAAG